MEIFFHWYFVIKGTLTYDIRKISVFFDPLPIVHFLNWLTEWHSCNLPSYICFCGPPSVIMDVICEWSLCCAHTGRAKKVPWQRQKATPHRSNSTINPDTVHGVQGGSDHEKWSNYSSVPMPSCKQLCSCFLEWLPNSESPCTRLPPQIY